MPIIAGVGRMRYRTFLTYNIVGGAMWGIGVTTLGYFLGEVEIVKHNLELAAIVIVAISLIPIAVEFFRSRRASTAHTSSTSTRPRLMSLSTDLYLNVSRLWRRAGVDGGRRMRSCGSWRRA